MAFRAEVRRALAAPLGGSLSRRFGAAFPIRIILSLARVIAT